MSRTQHSPKTENDAVILVDMREALSKLESAIKIFETAKQGYARHETFYNSLLSRLDSSSFDDAYRQFEQVTELVNEGYEKKCLQAYELCLEANKTIIEQSKKQLSKPADHLLEFNMLLQMFDSLQADKSYQLLMQDGASIAAKSSHKTSLDTKALAQHRDELVAKVETLEQSLKQLQHEIKEKDNLLLAYEQHCSAADNQVTKQGETIKSQAADLDFFQTQYEALKTQLEEISQQPANKVSKTEAASQTDCTGSELDKKLAVLKTGLFALQQELEVHTQTPSAPTEQMSATG